MEAKCHKHRLPRKFKKRLIKLNGREPVRKCIILAKLLSDTQMKNMYNLANVYEWGWAVKEGLAKPFEMRLN